MKQDMPLTELLCRQVSENTDRLYRLAYSYVKNVQDAMDIVQDAVCKLLKSAKGGGIRSPEYINTWMYRVTVNTALDFLRKHSRVSVGLPEKESGHWDDHSKLYLMEALDQLDEKSRAIVILRFFEDKTLRQIADILDLNLSTVKSRLYQALRTLKISLSEEEDINYANS